MHRSKDLDGWDNPGHDECCFDQRTRGLLSVNIEIRPEDMMDAPEFSGRGGIVRARALFGTRLVENGWAERPWALPDGRCWTQRTRERAAGARCR